MVSVGLVQCGQCGFGSVSDSSSCQLHFFISIGPFWCSQCYLTGILICCTGPFWSGSLCFLTSVCQSPQCLISTLRQAGGGGLLFGFACSVALWGGRVAAGRYRWRVWGGPTVFRPHWVCPAHRCLCFPRLHCSGSRLLHMECALHCVRFQFSGSPQKHKLGWACVLCLPRPDQLRQPGAWRPHCPRVRCAFPLRDQSGACALCLAATPPSGCRPSRISGSLWLETGGLFAVW